MEDGEVILIAPDTKNQDGTQTFFILDPLDPSKDCADDSPEIELIDLTTEEYKVQNTGAIAVLSTNSNTGALEITLRKTKDSKKIYEMDPESSNMKQSSSDLVPLTNDKCDSEMLYDDDMSNSVIKEEDEDIDVEEVNFCDVQGESGNNEHVNESVQLEMEVSEELEENNQDQIDLDDETEDTLYIDDAKCIEIQEDHSQEEHKLDIVKEIEHKNVEETIEDVEKIEITTDIKVKETEVIETSVHKKFSRDSEDISQNCRTLNPQNALYEKHDLSEALIHGQLIEIPRKENNFTGDSASKEYVDSTNTALTLLELAGNTSYRKSEVEGTGSQHYVVPSDKNVTCEEPESTSEELTLTTLQPVQFDVPSSSSPVIDQPEVETTAVTLTPHTKPVPPTPKTPGNIKGNTAEQVQRLREGDTPRHPIDITRVPKAKPGLISPIITQADIAKEILERSMQKCPYTEPSGGDYIFAMKLAHRLATKIVLPEKTDVEKGEKPKQDTTISTVSQNNTTAPFTKNDSATKTDNSTVTQQNYNISDKIELLKILEDDPDDPGIPDSSQVILEQKVKIEKRPKARTHPPLIKLHPELEKELALKQLEDFSRKKREKSVPEVVKRIKHDKGHEHNNNLNFSRSHNNGAKKRGVESTSKSSKKMKIDGVNSFTADPSQITETLTIEGQSLVDDHVKDGKSIKQYSNKRLSRNSETLPRQLPMDILLNGMDDMPSETENSSKNKIFKATNPRKRKEELKEKHFANVLQRNIKPHKKRGRPPKKKSYPTDDMLNKEFLLKMSSSKNGTSDNHNESSCNNSVSSKEEKPIKTKKMREIERLLGDEGAINMLYSVEQKRIIGSEPKRGMLPSYRRKKKDLILKTKLVKSAVLRLTTNPPQVTGRISLRGQAPKEGEGEESDKTSLRKMSVDSHDSHHSLSSPPPENFPFPAKIVPAEASRIIRRHSSSSNYSSRSNSPRRLSTDGDRTNVISPEMKATDNGNSDSVTCIKQNKHSKTTIQTLNEVVKRLPDKGDMRLLQEKSKENVNKDHIPSPKTALDSKKSPTGTPINSSIKGKCKLTSKSETPLVVKRGRRPKKIFSPNETRKSTELNTSLAAALEDFAKENKSDDKNIPSNKPKKLAVPSPKITAKAVYGKSLDTPRVRTPKPSVVYKELTLSRHDHVVEISLAPVSTKLQNGLNSNVLRELTSVLNGLSKDENCRIVLITSTGQLFCQGVDFLSLLSPIKEQRTKDCMDVAVAIKEFIKALAMFSKPVVAGVQGPAIGLGVTMLPLCDMILAAHTATFYTPYAKLGYVPEGAASLTFPSLLGQRLTSEMLLACQKYTATEALQAGLVTRILQAEHFRDELLSVTREIASQSSQAMNATKALLRHGLITGLETTLMSETHLLIQHWTTTECQNIFTNIRDNGNPDFVLAPNEIESNLVSENGLNTAGPK